PRIELAAHSFQGGGELRAEQILTVLAIGEPGQKATFAIGSYKWNIPMSEFEAGKYIGRYKVESGDFAEGATIVVYLENLQGATGYEVIRTPSVRLNGRGPAVGSGALEFMPVSSTSPDR
ncbi:MAG: hypothetical protein ACRD1Z_15190, partial [Vicinamibacteria bacterium]